MRKFRFGITKDVYLDKLIYTNSLVNYYTVQDCYYKTFITLLLVFSYSM